MTSLQVTDGRVQATSHLTGWGRLALLVVGLVPLLAPWELLVRPRWTTFASPFFAFALFISLGATGLAVLLMSGAVLGRSTRLVIARSERALQLTTWGLFQRSTRRVPLEQVTSVSVVTHESSEGPDTFSLSFALADGSQLESPWVDRVDAADQAAKLVTTWRDLVAPRRDVLSDAPRPTSPA